MTVGTALTNEQEIILAKVLGDLMSISGMRARMLTLLGEIDDAIAGRVPTGSISTAELMDGIFSADAAGRLKTADDYFNAATLLAKIATGAMTNAVTDDIFAADAFAADAASRAKFADDIWTAAKLANTLLERQYPMSVYGAWAEDGDGAETNGGGMCGAVPTITNQGAAFCKVYDLGTTTFSNLALTSALAGFAANFQIFADAASEEVGDYTCFGAALPFCEISFDMGGAGALATWGADGAIWEYWNGAAWVTLVLAYDNTDTTAQDGLRPFQQVGAMTFVPPADWATTTIDGQLAYFIRSRITALQLTQTPVTDGEEHGIISAGDEGWVCPVAGTLTAVRLNDDAGTLHTTRDVTFIIFNETRGTHSGELTFAQDKRAEVFTGLTLTVSAGDVLWVLCTQDDGAAEPSGVMLEMTITQTS